MEQVFYENDYEDCVVRTQRDENGFKVFVKFKAKPEREADIMTNTVVYETILENNQITEEAYHRF